MTLSNVSAIIDNLQILYPRQVTGWIDCSYLRDKAVTTRASIGYISCCLWDDSYTSNEVQYVTVKVFPPVPITYMRGTLNSRFSSSNVGVAGGVGLTSFVLRAQMVTTKSRFGGYVSEFKMPYSCNDPLAYWRKCVLQDDQSSRR